MYIRVLLLAITEFACSCLPIGLTIAVEEPSAHLPALVNNPNLGTNCLLLALFLFIIAVVHEISPRFPLQFFPFPTAFK